jgi:ATP-dependent RNA helicase RhlE
MLEPETVQVEPERVTAAGIEQRLHVVRPQDKTRALLRLLDDHRGEKVLVFTATREATSEVARTLRREGHEVVSLSSLLSQNNRGRALDGFRSGDYDVLVATDVAGRGLDVVDIDVVINYDLPHNPEDYVHRVGRTGRAEREGLAISIATPRDAARLANVEKVLGVSLERLPIEGVETQEMGRGSSRRRPSRGQGRGRRQSSGRGRRGGSGSGRPRKRRD